MRLAERIHALRSGGKTGWEVHYEGLERAKSDHRLIVLSQGEHDFQSPASFVDAGVASLRRGRHHYTAIEGESALRAAIARRERTRTGVATDIENVIVQPGTQGALFAVAQCLLDPGDEAVLIAPHYVTYPGTLKAAGADLVTVASDPDRAFALDLEALEAAVTERTRVILLNSPNNPTGAIISGGDLARIGALAEARDLWLISDEVYAPFAYDASFVSPRSLPALHERTVVVSSLSKSHAMTGWRLGWAIGPASLIARMSDLALVMFYGLPGFIQDAALTALADVKAEATIVARYRRRRDLFVDGLRQEGVDVPLPAGGMNLMLDLRDTGHPSEDLAWRLLEDERVSVLPGDSFGAAAAGFLRISFCQSEARLAEAARRIGRFIKHLRNEGPI